MTAWLLLTLAVALQDAPSRDCSDPQTQSAMTACAGAEFEQADVALNAQWNETLAAMRARDADGHGTSAGDAPGYADALIAAQRAWLRFRDTHCRTEGYVARGGSMQPMLVASCKAMLTRTRTRQLRELLHSMTM